MEPKAASARILIGTLTAAILAAGVLSSTAVAATSIGTIAFHQKSFDDTSSDLWAAAADGTTGAVQLTSPLSAPDPTACWEGACGAEQPEWTPDGSRIFFDSSWVSFIHIWSMRPDGSDLRQETFSGDFEGAPALSRDGSLMAYDFGVDEGGDPSLSGIYVVPTDRSGAARQVTNGPATGFDTNPDFSPDGTNVVFQRFRGVECRHGCGGRDGTGFRASIWVVGTDGRGLHRITGDGRIWGDPHYSPDGSRILIQSYDDGKGRSRGIRVDEFTARPDGSGLTRLTHSTDDEVSFSGDWSPDGSQITFVHYQFPDDHLEIQVMDADGTNATPVADCDSDKFCDFPNWGTYTGALAGVGTAQARGSARASASTRRSSRVARRRAARRLRRAVATRLARGG